MVKWKLNTFLSQHGSAETQCWMRRYVRGGGGTYMYVSFAMRTHKLLLTLNLGVKCIYIYIAFK